MNNYKVNYKIGNRLKSQFLVLSLVTLVVSLSGMYSASAQEVWKASAGAQLSFMQLNSSDGIGSESSFDSGAGINLGISYSLNKSWSIHSGVGLSYMQASNSISSYNDRSDAVDVEGESFEFRYALDRYSENQQSMLLSIPVGVQYESFGNQTRWYAKAGASVNIFMSPTSQGSANTLITSGYYERFNGELTEPRFAGFGTFNNIEFGENDLDINNSFNAFFEIGIKEKFGVDQWVYFGVFVEYGLNDILENNGSSLIDYNTNAPMDFINNSSLNASLQSSGNALMDKLSMNIIGLRIKYEFGLQGT
ncbi:MAG: hypothetical protein ACJAXY_002126 [Nonlabens sp.]|jgi:hypothetical protein|uniref:hypothetical protein n=1 Tax=Nonlabens sp. TaxID=1888209 RepID=UPI0039E23BCD